jgi:hypothetical protein
MATAKPGSVPALFLEELEKLSARHRSCEIIYRAENGGRTVIRDRITEIQAETGPGEAETPWLRTASGLVIPLDALEHVDGKTPSKYC